MTDPITTTSGTSNDEIALRVLGDADRAALERLAGLDSAAPLAGDLLLGAEMRGRLLAAISIRDGAVVADPFTRSGAAVELLRLRAAQLGAQPPRRHGRLRRAMDALREGHAHAGLAGSPPGAGGKLLEL
jgi:hypothetical protein